MHLIVPSKALRYACGVLDTKANRGTTAVEKVDCKRCISAFGRKS